MEPSAAARGRVLQQPRPWVRAVVVAAALPRSERQVSLRRHVVSGSGGAHDGRFCWERAREPAGRGGGGRSRSPGGGRRRGRKGRALVPDGGARLSLGVRAAVARRWAFGRSVSASSLLSGAAAGPAAASQLCRALERRRSRAGCGAGREGGGGEGGGPGRGGRCRWRSWRTRGRRWLWRALPTALR